MRIYINGKKYSLHPRQALGKGGEADVFAVDAKVAVKIWKQEQHPDFAGLPEEQQAARQRLPVYREKLKEFPTNLPPRVITPMEEASETMRGKAVGYTMKLLAGAEPLLRLGERSYRAAGMKQETVDRVLLDLHGTVQALHRAGVVIGDFNDLNVLVQGEAAYVIDADSFQFGRFPCPMFTARFVDPLLCQPKIDHLLLCQQHNQDSDWYAFAVMWLQSTLMVGPYGGLFRPANSKDRLPHDARPLHRVTIFHPEVRYPKPAVPVGVLPDDVLHYFHQVFLEDRRGETPRGLLETMRWTRCTVCGVEHARGVCPQCRPSAPAAVKETSTVRGSVLATRVTATEGVVLAAAWRQGKVRWLTYEDEKFVREDGATVFTGPVDPLMSFELLQGETLVGRQGQILRLAVGRSPVRMTADLWRNETAFRANSAGCYWVRGGRLLKDGAYAEEFIGDVLEGQTKFWVGEKFGLGLYRAGELSVAFTFDAKRKGLNDAVKLPPFRGQWIDARCYLSDHLAWLFTASQEQGRRVHRCTVVDDAGRVRATAEADAAAGDWLSNIEGACAAGEHLFCATDEGLARVEMDAGRLTKTRTFPDTEPWLSTSCRLFAAPDGLYVVRQQDIYRLQMR